MVSRVGVATKCRTNPAKLVGRYCRADTTAANKDADLNIATLSYGLGNWWLLRGDTSRARAYFEHSVMSGGWPTFGFIMSEVELRRTR